MGACNLAGRVVRVAESSRARVSTHLARWPCKDESRSMQVQATVENQPLAGRREWIGLCVLSIACLIYSMDLSVLFLAMPAIVADLDPSASELLWINDIYGFMVAGFLVTMGTLGDRIGRRRVLLIGAFAFGAASALAAFSSTAQQLIVSRALLGIAGATFAPSTLSLVVNLFSNENERHRAIGIWGAAFALGGLGGASHRWRSAAILSLGIGVSDQHPDHARAAGRGTLPAAGIQARGRREARSA